MSLVLTENNIAKIYERLTGHHIDVTSCPAAFDAWDVYEQKIIKDGGFSANGIFYPIGQ